MMNQPGIFGSLILLFMFNSSTSVLPVPSSAGSLRGVWTQSWRGWLLAFSHTRLCAHSNNQVQQVEQGGDERKKCIIVSCADTAQGVLQGSKGYFYGNMWHISFFSIHDMMFEQGRPSYSFLALKSVYPNYKRSFFLSNPGGSRRMVTV